MTTIPSTTSSSLKTFVAKAQASRKVAMLAQTSNGVTLCLRKGSVRFALAIVVVVARPEGGLAYSLRASRKLFAVVIAYLGFGIALTFLGRNLGMFVACLCASLITSGVWIVRYYGERAKLEAEIQSFIA